MPIIKPSKILIEHWLNIARDKNTHSSEFKVALENIASLLFSEAFNEAEIVGVKKHIKTPIRKTQARFIEQKNIYIVPILRAALGMLQGVKDLVPEAKVAHVGLFRNEKTLQPKWYLDKLPKKITKRSVFFILEPMLATGGTITAVLQRIIILGGAKIYVISALIAEETKRKLEAKFPHVNFYVAGIDPELNKNGYIVPGLGDAGDRVFNV